jgi:hypothetical protein
MGYAGRLNLCRTLFDIPLIDYGRPSYGLLAGSGTGTMMAIMDATERFRFALDLDACRGREDNLRGFIRALDRNELIDLLALAGWFSITDPKPIAVMLKGLTVPVIIYSGAGLSREFFGDLPFVDTLDDFLACVREAGSSAPAKALFSSIAPLESEFIGLPRGVVPAKPTSQKDDAAKIADVEVRANDYAPLPLPELATEPLA